jgi:hypothetical protein
LGIRIEATFSALAEALADPPAGEMASQHELAALRRSLEEADRRLVLVDALLAEAPEDSDPGVLLCLQKLRRARADAASESEAVLSGVRQLRIPVGLLALAGDALPVRERWVELWARLAALDELSNLEGTYGP